MEIVGFIGILIIQVAYWPQAWQILQTGNTQGISLWFIFMLWFGQILLQIYSYHVRDIVYILSNWLGLANTSLIMFLILKFRGWL